MKRALMYVVLFFGICFFIGNYSDILWEPLNEKIIFKYADNVVTEIQDKVNDNETLYLNGKIIAAYVIGANEKNIMLNNHNVSLKAFAGSISDDNIYKVNKDNGFLNIINAQNNVESPIQVIQRVGKVTRNKNIIMNVLTVIIGIGLYFIYTKSEKARICKS